MSSKFRCVVTMYPYRDAMMNDAPINDTVSYSFSLVVRKGICLCQLGKIINHREDESITVPSDGQTPHNRTELHSTLVEGGPLSSGISFRHCAWSTTLNPVLDVIPHT